MKKQSKFRNWRWVICGGIFLAVVLSFVDRLTFEVATPLIAREFSLKNEDIGTVAAAFIVAYYPGMILWGRITDFVGSRIGMSIAVAWWSTVEILTTRARTATAFGVYRFLLGLGESAVGPGGTRAVAEWFGVKERALAIGLFTTGASVAGIIGSPLTAFIMVRFGWRSAFILPGLLGFGWVLMWLILYRPLATHPYVSVEEKEAITADMPPAEFSLAPGPQNSRPMSWGDLFRYRQIWGVMTMRFFSEPFGYVFGAFMPKYLVTERGVGVMEMGLLMGIPPISNTFGLISGGVLSRHLTRKGWSLDAARKSLMVLGLLLVPLSVPLVLTHSRTVLIGLLVVLSFGLGVWSANVNALPLDLAPRHLVASAHGILALGGGTGGLVAVKLAGMVADKIGSLAPVLEAVFLLPVLGALVTIFGLGKIEMLKAASDGSRRYSVGGV